MSTKLEALNLSFKEIKASSTFEEFYGRKLSSDYDESLNEIKTTEGFQKISSYMGEWRSFLEGLSDLR